MTETVRYSVNDTAFYERACRFREVVQQVLNVAIREGMTGDRRGAWLYLVDDWARDRPRGYHRQLGEVSETSKSQVYSVEKAARVRRLRATSSAAEHDSANNQYLGAVHLDLGRLIASLSGLPDENVDEAVMLVTGMMLMLISEAKIHEIIAASHNEIYWRLLEMCCRDPVIT